MTLLTLCMSVWAGVRCNTSGDRLCADFLQTLALMSSTYHTSDPPIPLWVAAMGKKSSATHPVAAGRWGVKMCSMLGTGVQPCLLAPLTLFPLTQWHTRFPMSGREWLAEVVKWWPRIGSTTTQLCHVGMLEKRGTWQHCRWKISLQNVATGNEERQATGRNTRCFLYTVMVLQQ